MIVQKVNNSANYKVVCASGEFEKVGEYIKAECGTSKALIVTDSNVAQLYLSTVYNSLKASGFDVYSFSFEAGEKSKTARTYLKIIDILASFNFTRGDLIVALGGGIVGDTAGFSASTFMRGINYVQIPTTLLSAVDSSIGGKTGVNLSFGKNLLGSFHQPKLVFFDDKTLDTLDDIEFKNGLCECVKYGILDGGEIFETLKTGAKLNKFENIEKFISLCQKSKIDIVEKDEFESGSRKLLNLGHTIGHAVEKLSDYKIPHGFAVAYGLKVMLDASFKCGEIEKEDYDKIVQILYAYDLIMDVKFSIVEMIEIIKSDKKMTVDGKIEFIKIKGIGKCEIACSTLDEFINFLS